MSPQPDQARTGEHLRATDLAALQLDEPLTTRESEWLERHLAGCADCRSIAAEYEADRALLRGLRDTTPVPPRDLWARTSAAIEAEHRTTRRPRTLGWLARLGGLPLAPIAALMVVVMVVGTVALNGFALPFGSGKPIPTPISGTAGQVLVLTRHADGSLTVSTKRYDQVCPIGATVCSGTSSSDGTTQTISLADLGLIDAYLSPGQDHIVVLQKGTSPSGVFVVPVNPRPTPTATIPVATGAPTGSPTPTAPAATPEPTVSPSEQPSPTPSDSPAVGASPSPTDTPAPSPSVDVTPQPNGTIQIASNVIVVGSISAYSPDGTQFAFTARPADGSTGPDIYLWNTGESQARPVTSDHSSLFAAWVGTNLLISRVVNGTPTTTILDPSTGTETPVDAGTAWRPAPGPGNATAVWWDGTITPSNDGFGWDPVSGRLVLGGWPTAAAALASGGAATPAATASPNSGASPLPNGAFDLQTLAQAPIREWQVRWDPAGVAMAVWITSGAVGAPGLLSLYAIDPVTGAANLTTPMLSSVPAYDGFSLVEGRLTYSAPDSTGGSTIEVLAWVGTSMGQLELRVGDGTTIVR